MESKEEIKISFEFIKDRCETIRDVIKLEHEVLKNE